MTIDYLLIGHITADLLADSSRIAGGTVSYAAPTAQAFGHRVGIVTGAARGEPLLESLRAHAEVCAVDSDATTTYENRYTPEGRVQIVRAAAGDLTAAMIPTRWHDAPLVHLAPIAGEARHAALFDLFPQARIMITPQGWMRQWDATGRVRYQPLQDQDAALIARASVVVLSEEDIQRSAEAEAWLAAHAPRVVITQAERGGVYYVEGAPHRYAAVSAAAVDPTGAGDIFATALLCAWHQLGDFHRAVRAAALLAADSVGRRGTSHSAPSAHTVAQALESV